MAENTEKVKSVIAKIKELPTLPIVVTRILQVLDNPKSTANDINKVIQTDQVLTAKTLKMVNSAYYGFPRKIGTVTDAVVILGFNTVKSLALSATICKMFKDDGSSPFSKEKLWEHSIAVAFASRILAKKVKYADEEDAFVAGLLHDIAKVIEDQNFHKEFVIAIERSKNEKISLLEAEKEEVGMDHSLIGRRVADRWNLPVKVTKVIGYHHLPEFSGAGDEKMLTCIVHVADALVKIRKIGDSGNHGPINLNKVAVQTLKITKKDLADVVQKLLKEMEKASEFLSIVKE